MECGGLRVCELNPPHSAGSGGVGKLVSKIKAKIFLSRNLAFLLAARRPPHSTTDCRHRLLFCFVFFDRIEWDSISGTGYFVGDGVGGVDVSFGDLVAEYAL